MYILLCISISQYIILEIFAYRMYVFVTNIEIRLNTKRKILLYEDLVVFNDEWVNIL